MKRNFPCVIQSEILRCVIRQTYIFALENYSDILRRSPWKWRTKIQSELFFQLLLCCLPAMHMGSAKFLAIGTATLYLRRVFGRLLNARSINSYTVVGFPSKNEAWIIMFFISITAFVLAIKSVESCVKGAFLRAHQWGISYIFTFFPASLI